MMNGPEERMLDVALEELLGEKAPPDLRTRILGRSTETDPASGGGRQKAVASVAAALLLCLGVLWTVVRVGAPGQEPNESELSFRLQFPEGFTGDRKDVAQRARQVVQRRLEARGVSGATVVTEEDVRLIVRFSPADREVFEGCKELIGKPGRLKLCAVAPKEVQEAFNKDKKIPEGFAAIDVPSEVRRKDGEYDSWSQPQILIQNVPIVEAKNIVRSEPRSEVIPGGIAWVTEFGLDPDGAKRFDEAAGILYPRQPPGMIAIVLDGVLRSTPAVQAEKFGGQGVISGAKDEAEARDLSIVLRSGALPVPVKLESGRFVVPRKK